MVRVAAARSGAARRARAADALARAHRTPEAEAEWRRLWDEGGGSAELGARLAWAALAQDRVADAAGWVMRARAGEARSSALGWAAERVREAGGLVGAPAPPLPLRSLEWAALAFALALGALLEWPRRWSVALLAGLALAAALAVPAQRARLVGTPLAIVRELTPLTGADLELEPGEVVAIERRAGDRLRVRAGRGVSGEVPAAAVVRLWGRDR